MRTILIDDEEPSREFLKDQLKAYPEIEIIAEAPDGLEAIEMINQLRPDLIFLDVQMPVLDGFTVLSYLKCQPMVVFCTAHDDYAIKAFETNALDYLLKPVSKDRLALSLDKIGNEWHKIGQIRSQIQQQDGLKNIVCHHNNTYHVFWLRDIDFFTKEGRYTAVQTSKEGTYLTDLTVDYLDKHLQNPHFFRINRATIIRRDIIRHFKIQTYSTGKIDTENGLSFTVSRGRLQSFKQWFLD